MTPVLKVRLQRVASIAERSLSLPDRTLTNSCISPLAVLRFGSTKSLTGLRRDMRTSSSTESVIVAEKSIVCRDVGHALMISASSSANPSESIRSASSNTRMSSASRMKAGELRMWSISRPGVAMTTSGRVRRAASWDLIDSPPILDSVYVNHKCIGEPYQLPNKTGCLCVQRASCRLRSTVLQAHAWEQESSNV
jgi:hypothetical protein